MLFIHARTTSSNRRFPNRFSRQHLEGMEIIETEESYDVAHGQSVGHRTVCVCVRYIYIYAHSVYVLVCRAATITRLRPSFTVRRFRKLKRAINKTKTRSRPPFRVVFFRCFFGVPVHGRRHCATVHNMYIYIYIYTCTVVAPFVAIKIVREYFDHYIQKSL